MDSKLYIGIDVGSKGFIAMQYEGNWKFYSIEDNDLYSLNKILAQARAEYNQIACAIEDVRAIFGSSAKSTFAFGFNKGYLVGLLAANNIPYTLVLPQVWQRGMWTSSDKAESTKQTSLNCAKRLFPLLDFRKSERAKKYDDNKVDATLICEWARRKNL